MTSTLYPAASSGRVQLAAGGWCVGCVDDLYTVLAATWQGVPISCWGVARCKHVRGATWQPAPASFWVMARATLWKAHWPGQPLRPRRHLILIQQS